MGWWPWRNWSGWSERRLEQVQDKVLERVSARSGFCISFKRQRTQLSATEEGATSAPTERVIHSIECRSVRCDEAKPPIVLLHGYGGGGLLFVGNMARLAAGSGRKVIAVDWLGCGASGRPEFTPTEPEEAITWFLDAFEEWVDIKKLDKFDMVAHSLGGYLGAQYVLRGGHAKIDNLILASPAGIPEPPARRESAPLVVRAMRYLWESGFNPHMLVRTTGPLGRSLVKGELRMNFGSPTLGVDGLDASDDADRRLFADYLYQIAAAPESGEHALAHILMPGTWAKLPLMTEMHKLLSNVLIIFGDRDWLKRDLDAARLATKRLDAGQRSEVQVLAGTHHVYLDKEFDAKVLDFIAGKSGSDAASASASSPPLSEAAQYPSRSPLSDKVGKFYANVVNAVGPVFDS